MKNFVLSGLAAVAVCALAPAANAATFTINDPNNPDTGFFTTNVATPDFSYVNASFQNVVQGVFSDTYQFLLPKNGFGSGSLSASFGNSASIIIESVVIKTMGLPDLVFGADDFTVTPQGLSLVTSAIPIVGSDNVFSSVTVNGNATGNSLAYNGNITFEASAIPEASTWALMILGIGAVGFAARRSRKTTVRVAYA